MTWSQVDGRLATTPVRGEHEDFYAAADHFVRVEQATTEVILELDTLTAGDTSEFDGQAAQAFVESLRGTADQIRDVPCVARSISTIFRDHATALERLHGAVDRALAAALTTRAERDALQAAASDSAWMLDSIESQLASLEAAGASPDDPTVVRLEHRATVERTNVINTRRRLTVAEDELAEAIAGFHRFQDDECDIDRWTASRLDGVDLRAMADPSSLEAFASWAVEGIRDIGGFVEEFIADVVALATAGSLAEFCFRLNDALRAITKVLGLLTLVFPCLAPFALGFALATFALSAVLFATGTRDPETDRPMDWTTLAWDAVAVGTSALQFGAWTRTRGLAESKVWAGTTSRTSVYYQRTGQFATKPVAAAYRAVQADRLRSTVQDLDLFVLEYEMNREPDGVVRIAPPTSCDSGTRALVGCAR